MDDISEVRRQEERLRTAMLTSDVATLSDLIDDRLAFTGLDGSILDKAQDLASHETGMLSIDKLDITETSIRRIESMVLTTTKADLAGSLGEVTIAGSFAYTRLWSRSSGRWRVVAGHVSAID